MGHITLTNKELPPVLLRVPGGVKQGRIVDVLVAIHGNAKSAVCQAWRRASVGAAVVHLSRVGVPHLNRSFVVCDGGCGELGSPRAIRSSKGHLYGAGFPSTRSHSTLDILTHILSARTSRLRSTANRGFIPYAMPRFSSFNTARTPCSRVDSMRPIHARTLTRPEDVIPASGANHRSIDGPIPFNREQGLHSYHTRT